MIAKIRLLTVISLIIITNNLLAQTGSISGVITDKKTKETLTGASAIIETLNKGAFADLNGRFTISGLSPGTYNLKISYISYKTEEIIGIRVVAGQTVSVDVELSLEENLLQEVVVTAERRMNNEIAMIQVQKASLGLLSSVSAQQITKTQARDASEVIKRIPGIAIIENRFIVARGLAQRYNNVWVNNNAVPSSEADSRAFSFDMIPSAQIENIIIIKSPAPELPADFTGGFVKIATKSVPEENSLQISYGTNFNTMTHFRDFKYSKGSPTDFLGFDNGFRALKSVVPSQMIDGRDRELVTNVTRNGFNNDWLVHSMKPFADHRLSVMLNRSAKLSGGGRLGMIAAFNYSYSYLTFMNMTNSRFGIYNKTEDIPVYSYKYEDDQYTITAKTGGMLNMVWVLSNNHRLEFRNIFNQQGHSRYTYRDGWQEVSGFYEQQKEEYLYSSRGTYTGQFSGIHNFSEASKLDWTIGYSYTNKNQPDRREINRQKTIDEFEMENIKREFIRLDEDMWSAGANYNHILPFATLKTGAYVENRSRDYNTRYFIYRTNSMNLPDDFLNRDVATEMMLPEYFSADKFYVSDATRKTNDYKGDNLLASGYLGLNIPLGKFNIYAGARYENNLMKLTNYVTLATDETEIYEYPSSDIFPTINASYNINNNNLLRLAYGKSINRQEFREVSPSAFYDFDLFSFVRGNQDLKQAYIQNFDLRYEVYPSSGEMISLALFYKKFDNPIEWTFRDSGGSYTYTFENAEQANSYGVELDVKKSMDFIGLPDISLSFNGALIRSEVMFSEESMEHDRPMQGQSPYLINAGLFYQRDKLGAGLMYNIIGKRIVGIGRNDNSQGGSIDNDVPDMYEMPRHAIDLSLSYRLGKRIELSAGVRDILAAPMVYKQFPKFIDGNGKIQQREQITKEYKPGQNISVTFKLNL